MKLLNPYIKFNGGKCREALDFYKDVLGGEIENVMTVAGSPMEKDFPPEKRNLIMHSTVKKGNLMLFCSDMMRDTATIGDNIGIALECDNEKEVDAIFAKLEKGGDVFMKPEKAFWGGYFGMVTDKYGVEWMLNCAAKK